ncbi:hypothetical protein, partial [Cytobacillus praedii]
MSNLLKESLDKFAKNEAIKRNEQIKLVQEVTGKVNENFKNKLKNRYSWLIIGSISSIVAVSSFVVVYNVIAGEKINIDVATVLSTMLAFFSIFLSSFFYFKATEQSNQ